MAGSGIISDIPACPVFLCLICIVMISGLRIKKPWRKIRFKKNKLRKKAIHSPLYVRLGYAQRIT